MDQPFVQIPGGSFSMGSDEGAEDERPVHRVYVDAFELAIYPVTAGAYDVFMRATGHTAPREWSGDPSTFDRPVVGVSWVDSVAYCDWMSRTGEQYRLPTEAEWEHAARGGLENKRYPWGDEIPPWIPDGGRGPIEGPWPVTLGEPNGFGLFGIGANIHEWCADWYAADYYASSPSSNPQGPSSGSRRASRGGAWRHAVTISRCSARSRIDPTFRYTDYGFRIARTISRRR
jgi:sulfatase modifying factor 1